VTWSVAIGCAALAFATLVAGKALCADPTVSLSGTLIRNGPSLVHTVTVSSSTAQGYQVYIRPLSSSTWIGPIYTDVYGRFTFYGLAPGSYQLRIYDGPVHVWDQIVPVTGTNVLAPMQASAVTVVYYRKSADGARVLEALHGVGYPFQMGVPTTTIPTNAVWYGKLVSQSDLGTVVAALIKGGVSIRAVCALANGTGARGKVVEVGSLAQFGRLPIVATAGSLTPQRSCQQPN
jgi:hypothetical protein